MKLKQAKKEALPGSWVAVDESGNIYSYSSEPECSSDEWIAGCQVSCNYLGGYTGNKHWTKTLREVV